MSINMGSWDRVLRVVVGLVLIGLAATGIKSCPMKKP